MNTFCRWQEEYQTNHSVQADVAVLVTRTDMCRKRKQNNDEMCNTLGLAQLGSMCDPTR